MIQLEQLVKKNGERVAVDHLELKIFSGEVFGLLGPNGAGKTTIIRMLSLLTRPTAGRIEISGYSLPENEERVKALLGIAPQHFNLDLDLTVGENLDLHGRLHHMEQKERKLRSGELLEYVELQDRIHDKVQNLSGGMKRRLMIARALFHRPRILFLDEPTVGLDPQVRRKLWNLIRRLRSEKITVVLTTHYIEEAEALCGRVAILEKGRLIALDSPDELRRHTGEYVVEWTEDDGCKTQFFHDRSEAASFAAKLTVNATIRRSNLEDVFVELTGRKVSD